MASLTHMILKSKKRMNMTNMGLQCRAHYNLTWLHIFQSLFDFITRRAKDFEKGCYISYEI
jgi:uncharacterized membrane protein